MNQNIQSAELPYEIVDDSMSFKELFQIVMNYKYLVMLMVAGAAVLGALYVFFIATPVYEASGELLLKPAQQSVLESSTNYQSGSVMEARLNDALIRIRGTAITDSVVVKTNSFATVSLTGRAYNKITYFAATPPPETLFYHVFPVDESMGDGNYVVIDDDGAEIGRGRWGQRLTTRYLSVALSDMRGIDEFDIIIEPLEIARDWIREGLSLRTEMNSNAIQFSFRSSNPNMAQNVVNIYMQEFLYRNLLDKREEASALRAFLEQEFIEVSGELDSAEQKYLELQKSTGLVSLDEQTTQYIELLSFLEQKRIDYQIRLAEAKAAKEKNETILTGAPDFEMFTRFASSPAFQENTVFNDLYGTIAELQIENARLLAEYNVSHPMVIQNQAELDAARARLQDEIATRVDDATQGVDPFLKPVIENQLANIVNIEVYQKQLDQVRDEISDIEHELDKLPQASVNQAQIQRELDSNEQTYNQLQARLQEAKIMEGSTINDVEVINWAETPDHPVAPSKLKIMLAAIMGGLFLSLGSIAGIEFFRTSYTSVDEVERDLGIPVMSVIPRIPELRQNGRSVLVKPVSKQNGDASHLGDLFSSTFVNSLIYGKHGSNASQTFVVTSALPKEGKSVITANMAVAASLTNNKVLIIDCDFRNPIQHKIFNIPNEHGFFEIVNSNSSKYVVNKTIYPNLLLIPPGQVDAKVALSTLMKMDTFQQRIDKLREHFDYIFFDSPPVHVYSDTSLLTSFMKNVIFVMKIDSDKSAIRQALKRLKGSGATVRGIVVNDMHTSHFSGKSYSRYTSNYYSGYGYEYSQDKA